MSLKCQWCTVYGGVNGVYGVYGGVNGVYGSVNGVYGGVNDVYGGVTSMVYTVQVYCMGVSMPMVYMGGNN